MKSSFAIASFFILFGIPAAGGLFAGTPDGENTPSLLGYFPQDGYDETSLRYFPTATAYETWSGKSKPAYLDTEYDMEIAQARYSLENHSGMLFLLKFPTPELAEDYYDNLALPDAKVKNGSSVYARHVGPLVACLEGDFDPPAADALLKSIKFGGYSVRWDHEQGQSNAIWGIPFSILGAVVNSLIFVMILSLASILLGTAVGAGRFVLNGFRSRRRPEESHFIRLRLR